MTRTLPRRVVVLATAVAGVVAGHAAAYALAFPNGAQRAAELHATGHGYWGGAVTAAVGAGVMALAALAWRTARGDDLGVRALPLALGQLALFTVAEGSERVAAGVPLSSLGHAPEFAVGLALQLVVAVAAVLVLRRWCRLVAALVAPPSSRPSSSGCLAVGDPVSAVVTTVPRSSIRTRGPPLLAAA